LLQYQKMSERDPADAKNAWSYIRRFFELRISLCKCKRKSPPELLFASLSVTGILIVVNMPRSATDATRFTSTTPHASAKPPASALNLPGRSNSLPPRTPGPPGETPQEKVRRLRAAADRARDAQISTLDRLLVRGRVWADRAHRFTALSLIGATGMPLPYSPPYISICLERKLARRRELELIGV
jgi:hypothetical protein